MIHAAAGVAKNPLAVYHALSNTWNPNNLPAPNFPVCLNTVDYSDNLKLLIFPC